MLFVGLIDAAMLFVGLIDAAFTLVIDANRLATAE